MAQRWYYARGGQKVGPVTSQELRYLAASGTLQPADLVWVEGNDRGKEARSVVGLFPAANGEGRPEPPPLPGVRRADAGSTEACVTADGSLAGRKDASARSNTASISREGPATPAATDPTEPSLGEIPTPAKGNPERLEIRPTIDKKMMSLLTMGCIIFTLGGFLMMASGERVMTGLLAVLFFGGGGLYAIPKLLHRPVSMVLSREGIEQRGLFGTATIRWEDVERVGLVTMYGNKLVGLRLARYDGYLLSRKDELVPLMKRFVLPSVMSCNRLLCGYDIAFSWADLDRPAADFVTLLEPYKNDNVSEPSSISTLPTTKGRLDGIGEKLGSLTETTKAAARLAAAQARKAHLVNVTLRAAYLDLGKDIYAAGRFRDEFPEQYAEIAEVERRIEQLTSARPQAGTATGLADRAIRAAAGVKAAAQAKALSMKKESLVRQLGESAYGRFGDRSGHGPLVHRIAGDLSRLGELDQEIQVWRESGAVKGLFPGTKGVNHLVENEVDEEISVVGQDPPTKQPWYCHWIILSLTTLLCFPITLALVWWKSTYSMRAKWAWTGACCLMLLIKVENDKQKREAINRGDSDVAAVNRREGNMPSKWGFVDPTGKMAIACQFDGADSFDQGLAAVEMGGKWGCIDRTGQTKIPMEFDHVGWFREGRAPVKQGGKWGYVDRTGRLIIDCLYEKWGQFEDGHARVKRDGKSLFIDINGIQSTPQESKPQLLVVGHGAGARFGFEDNTGKIIVNPQFDAVSDFSESDVAVVSAGRSSGIIDKQGKWIVRLQSRYHFRAFPKHGKTGMGFRFVPSEGLFAYQDNREMREGYIKGTGEIAITAQFALATPFSEELACVTPAVSQLELERDPSGVIGNPIYGKTGYIDTTGKFVIAPQFSGGSRFSEGLAAVKVGIEGGKWGFINKSGEFVIRPEFDETPSDFTEGHARVKQGGLYGFIDKRGKLVVSPRFAEASDFSEGLARVRCP